MGGNLVSVLPASGLFVGIYELTKRKLLDVFPENLRVVAHLVSLHTLLVGLTNLLKAFLFRI